MTRQKSDKQTTEDAEETKKKKNCGQTTKEAKETEKKNDAQIITTDNGK